MGQTLRITKYINDNVYGGIGLTENEFKIVNTRTFQRLRRIKQQGFTTYTFPSAEHTRFSHSLGVLHVMGKITDRLVGLAEMTVEQQKVLRYAALLHDVGHYPLSHLTEMVYNVIEDNKKGHVIVAKKGSNNKVEKENMLVFANAKTKKIAHHEKLGGEVIRHRKDIRDILVADNCNPDEIAEIITGETPNLMYHQCMHSSVDADRIDYLLRDSTAAGVNYGLIDLDYLIRLMCVGEVEAGKNKKEKSIGINIKGIHTLEHYLMSRYFSYSQVTLHRTSTAYETLAKTLIYYLARENHIYQDYEEILECVKDKDEKRFLGFDDSYIISKFGQPKYFEGNPIYTQYATTLIERERIKTIFEDKILLSKEENKQTVLIDNFEECVLENLEIIAKQLDIEKENIGYTIQMLDVDSNKRDIEEDIKKATEAARVYKDGKCIYLADCDSSLVKELFDKQLVTLRVFYIDKYPWDDVKSDTQGHKGMQYIANILKEVYN